MFFMSKRKNLYKHIYFSSSFTNKKFKQFRVKRLMFNHISIILKMQNTFNDLHQKGVANYMSLYRIQEFMIDV